MRTCPDGFSPLIKPVIAWPGDTVEISASGIVVNGQPLPNTATISRDSTRATASSVSGWDIPRAKK